MKNHKSSKWVALVVTIIALVIPISAQAETVHLEWNAPTTGGRVSGYHLYYGQSEDIATMTMVPAPNYATVYSMDLPTQGRTYYFRLKAFNGAGEGPASEAKVVNIHLQVR